MPLAECDPDDGRVVGRMLVELMGRKPKDAAHAIREFAGRTAMLRECGFGVGATHQTVLERGTTEHSDRPHRGQASAVRASHLSYLGPESGPRWTRCDNREWLLGQQE